MTPHSPEQFITHGDGNGNLYDAAGAIVPLDQVRDRLVAEMEEIAYQEYWRVAHDHERTTGSRERRMRGDSLRKERA